MNARLLWTFLSFILFFSAAQAQPGWNWPNDEDMANTAKEKNALYSDALKAKEYRRSANHLSWLLVNTPDLNKSIYIKGVDVYEGLASKANENAKEVMFYDSALLMYDLRIKHFNEKPGVLNRKAFSAYKFFKDNQDRLPQLMELFAETVEQNGTNTWPNNLLAYMDVVRRNQGAGANMSNEEILEIYGTVEGLINDMIAKAGEKDKEKLGVISEQIENMLVAIVDVDCAFITDNLAPKFRENPELKLAKNILRLSIAGKCLGEAKIAVEAAKYIFDNDRQEFGLAKLIASKCYEAEDFDCAEKYYEQALTLTDDNDQLAETNLSLANLALKKGKKASARDYAKKAINVDPNNEDAAKFIASLYMNSYNDCKEGKDPVKDRAIFIAAYNWYQKAGDASGMAKAKEQFPSMEEIFTWNHEVGESISIGCWVNETVAIQRRD